MALKAAPADVRALADTALAVRDELVAGPPEELLLLHGNFRQGKVLAA